VRKVTTKLCKNNDLAVDGSTILYRTETGLLLVAYPDIDPIENLTRMTY